jgi:hypothetical protein
MEAVPFRDKHKAYFRDPDDYIVPGAGYRGRGVARFT